MQLNGMGSHDVTQVLRVSAAADTRNTFMRSDGLNLRRHNALRHVAPFSRLHTQTRKRLRRSTIVERLCISLLVTSSDDGAMDFRDRVERKRLCDDGGEFYRVKGLVEFCLGQQLL